MFQGNCAELETWAYSACKQSLNYCVNSVWLSNWLAASWVPEHSLRRTTYLFGNRQLSYWSALLNQLGLETIVWILFDVRHFKQQRKTCETLSWSLPFIHGKWFWIHGWSFTKEVSSSNTKIKLKGGSGVKWGRGVWCVQHGVSCKLGGVGWSRNTEIFMDEQVA